MSLKVYHLRLSVC